MSDMGDFAALVNIKGADVKPPIPGPIGNYKCLIVGPMKQHKAQTGNHAMRFPFKPVEPVDDVDAEAYAAFAAEGGFGDKTFTLDFWMSPDARYRFTTFCVAMGISDQMNLLEMAEALANLGEPFIMPMSHQAAKDAAGNEDLTKPPYMRWGDPSPIA